MWSKGLIPFAFDARESCSRFLSDRPTSGRGWGGGYSWTIALPFNRPPPHGGGANWADRAASSAVDSTPARVAICVRCSDASTLIVLGSAKVSRKCARSGWNFSSGSKPGTSSVLASPMSRSGGTIRRSPSSRACLARGGFITISCLSRGGRRSSFSAWLNSRTANSACVASLVVIFFKLPQVASF